MERFACSEDVYRRLVQDSEEHWTYGLLAFALLEQERIEWTRNRERHGGAPPDATEIRRWYGDVHEGTLRRLEAQAASALGNYADEILKDIVESESRKTVDTILGEVRRIGHGWRQFWIGLAAGVASALTFAVLLAALAYVVLTDPSPIGIVNEIVGERIEEKVDGDQTR